MATPFVSATAALLLAQNPNRGASEVAAILRSTADPIAGDATGMGSGRLDAATALGCGDGNGPGDVAPPGPTVSDPSGEQQATSNPDTDKDKDKKKKKKNKKKGKKGRKNRR